MMNGQLGSSSKLCDACVSKTSAFYLLRVLIVSISFYILAGFAAHAQGMMQPIGPIAEQQRDHLIKVFFTTMIAVLPVIFGAPYLLWRYQRGKNRKYDPKFEFLMKLEYVIWGVPILITLTLAFWLWQANENLDPYKPMSDNPLQVQAVGLNWKWLFIYPEQGVASVGTLAIPQNQDVELNLTTDTVMLSFMVPQLAGQIYAMPGMVTKLNLVSEEIGTVLGSNMQYNGDGFSFEQIQVQTMSDDDWNSWIAAAQSAPALDAANYSVLAKPSKLTDSLTDLGLSSPQMSLSDNSLFQNIVMRYHSGQSVAANEQPGAPDYQGDVTQ